MHRMVKQLHTAMSIASSYTRETFGSPSLSLSALSLSAISLSAISLSALSLSGCTCQRSESRTSLDNVNLCINQIMHMGHHMLPE